jgi:hypothetical protein
MNGFHSTAWSTAVGLYAISAVINEFDQWIVCPRKRFWIRTPAKIACEDTNDAPSVDRTAGAPAAEFYRKEKRCDRIPTCCRHHSRSQVPSTCFAGQNRMCIRWWWRAASGTRRPVRLPRPHSPPRSTRRPSWGVGFRRVQVGTQTRLKSVWRRRLRAPQRTDRALVEQSVAGFLRWWHVDLRSRAPTCSVGLESVMA